MGKGDKKSKRGKIIAGSYGKSRMRRDSTPLHKEAPAEESKVKKAEKTDTKETKPKAKAAEKAPEKKAEKPKEEKVKAEKPKEDQPKTEKAPAEKPEADKE